jgi:hypothetical protein
LGSNWLSNDERRFGIIKDVISPLEISARYDLYFTDKRIGIVYIGQADSSDREKSGDLAFGVTPTPLINSKYKGNDKQQFEEHDSKLTLSEILKLSKKSCFYTYDEIEEIKLVRSKKLKFLVLSNECVSKFSLNMEQFKQLSALLPTIRELRNKLSMSGSWEFLQENFENNVRLCHYCSSKNDVDAVFCESCGKRMPEKITKTDLPAGLVCGSCGTKNKIHASFCKNCGVLVGMTNSKTHANQPTMVEPEQKSTSGQDFSIFVQKCLKPEFNEEIDGRTWNAYPYLIKVVDLLNSGDNQGAIDLAESAVSMNSNFSYLYYWWGTALLRIGSFERAKQVLNDGLTKVKSKFRLCNVLGEVELKSGNIKEAVYWWAQGMHCQETLENYGGSVDPYLYLYYIAEGAGLSNPSSSSFLWRVDQIRPGNVRLSSQRANDLVNLARIANDNQIIEVLSQLLTKYVVPKQTSKPKANSDEINHLIQQLLTGNDNQQEQAAKMLGELGDTRALEPLMSAGRNTLSLKLQIETEKAYKKIKEANHYLN